MWHRPELSKRNGAIFHKWIAVRKEWILVWDMVVYHQFLRNEFPQIQVA
jgi:hypothetical protein